MTAKSPAQQLVGQTGQRIGYARVSRDDQSLDLQLDALTKAGVEPGRIYQEKGSGKHLDRAELGQCLKSLRSGDTLVVWRLDRLARSLADLVKTMLELEKRGVFFESLTERIETQSPAGKLMFHVFGALAEFERNLTRERTLAGLASARARGRLGGRPAKLGPKDVREIKTLLADPQTRVTDVAKRYGVSRTTLYKAVAA